MPLEEIQASMDRVHDMTQNETRKFVARMQKEQPYIQVFVAAICERGDFDDENDKVIIDCLDNAEPKRRL